MSDPPTLYESPVGFKIVPLKYRKEINKAPHQYPKISKNKKYISVPKSISV